MRHLRFVVVCVLVLLYLELCLVGKPLRWRWLLAMVVWLGAVGYLLVVLGGE